MKKMNVIQFVSTGSILTALSVIFQSSPVFLPVIGLALSPFSTIPIAIAAVLNIFFGITVLFSSALILIIISPQEAVILLFATGLLGTILGILLYRVRSIFSILVSAIALTLGMCALTYLVAVPGFAEMVESFTLPNILLIFFLFSLIYVVICSIVLRKFIKLLIRIKVIEKPICYINKKV